MSHHTTATNRYDDDAGGVTSVRTLRLHWLTFVLPVLAAIITVSYLALTAPTHNPALVPKGSSEVDFQRLDQQQLAELSRNLIEQFQREIREAGARAAEVIETNRNAYMEKVIREVAKEQADRDIAETPSADYASMFTGGQIIRHSPTDSFGTETYKLMNLPLFNYNRDPELLLHRTSNDVIPGLCWPFKGHSGFVLVRLATPVNITQIVYTHTAARLEPAPLRGSGPRALEAWVGSSPDRLEYFGDTLFWHEMPKATLENEAGIVASYVRFVVLQNYGAPFTCLYRLHVYGSDEFDLGSD